MNVVLVTGHVRTEPKMFTNAVGKPYCGFVLEDDPHGFRGLKTQYYRVSVYGGACQRCADELHEGMHIGIEGNIGLFEGDRSTDDKPMLSIFAHSVDFMPKE